MGHGGSCFDSCRRILPMFSSMSFIVSGLTLRSLIHFEFILTSLVAQMIKRLSTMWETWVRSLGWEDLLEKEMASSSSILDWKIPWMEEPGRLQPMGSQRIGHN